MSEPVKFTDEEMKLFAELQSKYQQNVVKFGQLQIKKYMIDDEVVKIREDEQKLKEEYSEIQKLEDDLLKQITEKYGEGSLNPKTGIFTPVNS
jgi:hypothetical protein